VDREGGRVRREGRWFGRSVARVSLSSPTRAIREGGREEENVSSAIELSAYKYFKTRV
jgi:hypothetical protein